MAETYLKVKGAWQYVYRAVDDAVGTIHVAAIPADTRGSLQGAVIQTKPYASGGERRKTIMCFVM